MTGKECLAAMLLIEQTVRALTKHDADTYSWQNDTTWKHDENAIEYRQLMKHWWSLSNKECSDALQHYRGLHMGLVMVNRSVQGVQVKDTFAHR